jgi:hypothetical protein
LPSTRQGRNLNGPSPGSDADRPLKEDRIGGGKSMSDSNAAPPMTRRALLRMIGVGAGGAAMYQAMTALGFAA